MKIVIYVFQQYYDNERYLQKVLKLANFKLIRLHQIKSRKRRGLSLNCILKMTGFEPETFR